MSAGWDAVVIGSGAGGMTAAVALARQGARVLVLEQHYLPGGWCHSFALEGYRFSPGVHYVGEVGPGGGVRALFEGLGVPETDLSWAELPADGYDHYLIGGERFDVPAGRARLEARLCARFPHERAGIARYFATIVALRDQLLGAERWLSFPHVLLAPLRAPALVRWGTRPLSALIDACVRDPRLRAILAANCGNHGLPPERASLPVHAAMVAHYLEGAWYPRGGARRIPQAMIRALRRHGGTIRTSTRVRRILVEGGRAVGVETHEGERIDARVVVSNADPAVTYGALLAPEHGARLARKARRAEYSTSMMSLFLAVDMDLRAAGLDGGNYWWFRTGDVAGTYARALRELPRGPLDGLFLAASTLKDPGSPLPNGHHTLELFTFVPWAPFARWEGSEQGQRAPEYEALKARLADQMLAAAEHVVPGLSRRVVFRSVGSPLTNAFYCESPRGAAYGLAKTPWQVGPFAFDVKGAVAGLYCCGASTLGHGVAGAMISGLEAARRALGYPSFEALFARPAATPAPAPARAADPAEVPAAAAAALEAAADLAPAEALRPSLAPLA